MLGPITVAGLFLVPFLAVAVAFYMQSRGRTAFWKRAIVTGNAAIFAVVIALAAVQALKWDRRSGPECYEFCRPNPNEYQAVCEFKCRQIPSFPALDLPPVARLLLAILMLSMNSLLVPVALKHLHEKYCGLPELAPHNYLADLLLGAGIVVSTYAMLYLLPAWGAVTLPAVFGLPFFLLIRRRQYGKLSGKGKALLGAYAGALFLLLVFAAWAVVLGKTVITVGTLGT